MSESLPPPLVEYALRRIVGERSPAYLLVAKSGEILEWGGHLEAYGVTGLEPGANVGSSVPMLTGALPIAGDPVVMPCVAMRGGIAADVHLVPDDRADWVLLLDASVAASYQHIGQQAGNELALLREKYEKLRARIDAKEGESR